MKLKTAGGNTSLIEVTNISNHGFWIYLNDQEYFLSFDDFPWFKDATVSAIVNVQLLHGYHLYWPELDIDLELNSIQFPEKYPLRYKS